MWLLGSKTQRDEEGGDGIYWLLHSTGFNYNNFIYAQHLILQSRKKQYFLKTTQNGPVFKKKQTKKTESGYKLLTARKKSHKRSRPFFRREITKSPSNAGDGWHVRWRAGKRSVQSRGEFSLPPLFFLSFQGIRDKDAKCLHQHWVVDCWWGNVPKKLWKDRDGPRKKTWRESEDVHTHTHG